MFTSWLAHPSPWTLITLQGPVVSSCLSFFLVHSPQFEDFFQDLDLEILDYLCCHFWALIKPLNPTSVIVNWQILVDLDSYLFWCVTFQHRHSNFVEDRVLHAFLRWWSEEWVVLQHVEDQCHQLLWASLEQILHTIFKTSRLVRTDFHLIIVYVFVWDEWKVILAELPKSVVDDDNLVITAHNIRFCGRLSVNWWNWIAGIAFKKETFLYGFGDKLLSLALRVLLPIFIKFAVDVELGAGEGFSKDAAHAPDVKGGLVFFLSQDNLRRSVPSWHNTRGKASLSFIVFIIVILTQHAGHSALEDTFLALVHRVKFFLRISGRLSSKFFSKLILRLENVIYVAVSHWLTSAETKVAQSHTTVTVDQKISWLEVPVH